ncbi:hypothetical protein F5Y14DRAFT_310715 [Nemania sp. NC0429]|nr:hypothetical protein F5Y14DRAFT_310715 [Nemania sp. NC0429]
MAASKKDERGKLGVIRPLGNVECYEFHMLEMGFLGGTIVNCRYTVPASLAAPGLHEHVVAQVEVALARVVLEHPALRLEVTDADTRRPAWVAVDKIDFAHHIRWEDISGEDTSSTVRYGEMLRERIEKLLDEPLVRIAGRPQWRVLLLFKKSAKPFLDIVFVYSHALGDGTSGKIFHQTLLRLLNASASPSTPTCMPPSGEETETETSVPVLTGRVLRIPPTARPLPPPIEKMSRFTLSAKFALSTAWRELRPPGLAPSRSSHAHWAPIRPTPFRTRLRVFDIEPGVLRGILTATRTHKTTVTGLLHALVLVSMAAHIPASDATAFVGATALDLRRHVGAHGPVSDPKRTMANYVSMMGHEYDEDLVCEVREALSSGKHEEDIDGGHGALSPALVGLIWQCAARVRGEIQKRLDQGLKNDVVGLMKLVPDWRAQFRNEASKARPFSFVVTNLGVLDGAGTQPDKDVEENSGGDSPVAEYWTAEHSVFAISTEVCGAAFQVSPITVRGGALCVSCSWQDCVVDVKLGEAIVADLERWLRFLGRS